MNENDLFFVWELSIVRFLLKEQAFLVLQKGQMAQISNDLKKLFCRYRFKWECLIKIKQITIE